MRTEVVCCPYCESSGPFTVETRKDGSMALMCDTCGEEIEVEEIHQESAEAMPRTRAMRRYLNWSAALRKRRRADKVYSFPYYNNLHQYSKGKIHCSCPLCSAKSKRPREGYVWKHSDRKQMLAMESQVTEYRQGDESYGEAASA